MDQIRILIADDHPLFRDGLRTLLESVPDMPVIGEAIFGPAIAQRLIHYLGGTRSTGKSGPAQLFPELTDREYEILTLLAQRKSNAEIAAHLVLSPKPVRNHVSNVLSKLQVTDRAEAIHAAWTAGLGQGDGERLDRDKGEHMMF